MTRPNRRSNCGDRPDTGTLRSGYFAFENSQLLTLPSLKAWGFLGLWGAYA
ncbi:hypothetical protein CKA32_002019 [Geitlerinema sp. FC II]|nr:hypothetical protein CKA32_002019 [Geitlerinema sp. FC II]